MFAPVRNPSQTVHVPNAFLSQITFQRFAPLLAGFLALASPVQAQNSSGASAIGALRLQREIGGESTLGFLLTDREFAGSFARAFAVDTRWKLSRTWVASTQLVRNDTLALNGKRRTGSGALAQLERKGRQVEYRGRYEGFSPDFAAPLGFVHRVGFHQTEQNFQYKWRPDRRPIVSFGPRAETLFNWERSGRLQDRELAGSFQVELTGETQIALSRIEAFERFSELPFRPDATELSIDTAIYVGCIDQYENVDIVAGNRPGLRRTSSPAMSVGRHVFVKVSYLLRF